MKRLVLLASFALIAGCEGMGRHDAFVGPVDRHVPPAPSDPQAVELTGMWGCYIEAVDGMEVDKEKHYGSVLGGGLGGNKTAILPGPRQIALFVTRNDDYYRTEFVFDFEPGHDYEVCRALNINEEKIRVHDKTTGADRYVR